MSFAIDVLLANAVDTVPGANRALWMFVLAGLPPGFVRRWGMMRIQGLCGAHVASGGHADGGGADLAQSRLLFGVAG